MKRLTPPGTSIDPFRRARACGRRGPLWLSRGTAFTGALLMVSFARAEPPSGRDVRSAEPHASSPPPEARDDVSKAPSPANAPSSEEAVTSVRVTGRQPPRSASEAVRAHDTLTAAPHKTASDVLAVLPGIFLTQHGGEGKAHQIFLRGFDAVHGQDIELWVGGLPVNEVSNLHGQGYADLHFVMPEIVREAVLLPGPYDPRQGDFAVAGTARLKLGMTTPGATLKATAGSFGTRRLFLAYHPKRASDETFAAFESYDTDGFGPNRAAKRGSLVAQGAHTFSSGLSMRVLGTTYAGRFDSAGVLPQASIESGALDRFATLDPGQGGASSKHQLLFELSREVEGERFSIAPFLGFRELNLRQNFTGYFLDTQRGGAALPASDRFQQLEQRVTAGLTGSYRRTVHLVSSRDAFEVGVYGRHDVIDQSQRRLADAAGAALAPLVDASVRATNVAGYADVALHPVRRVVVRGGVRADVLAFASQDRAGVSGDHAPQERTAQGEHFGKKATVDWAFAPGLHALASYGEGFRSPQARSLADGERTFLTEVSSYELGVRYADGRRFQGSLAGYYSLLSDDLVFDPTTARNERVPGTARRGLAAELVARAGDVLVLSGSTTYTDARFRSSDAVYSAGDRLPYVPILVLRSDLAMEHGLARALGHSVVGRLGIGLQGMHGRPLPYGELGRDVFLADATTSLRWRAVTLSLDVFNLFDADWYDGQYVYASNFQRSQAPSRVPFRHVTVGAPRTLWASVALQL